jgi:hypothetical protein
MVLEQVGEQLRKCFCEGWLGKLGEELGEELGGELGEQLGGELGGELGEELGGEELVNFRRVGKELFRFRRSEYQEELNFQKLAGGQMLVGKE